MYQVKRQNHIKETLQLCEADGTVAEEILVDLNVDIISSRVNKAYEMLGMAQNDLQANMDSPELITAYGNAVIAIFDVIFGVEGREKIFRFYEGNFTEMLLDLFPFINDVVMPRIREVSEARMQQILAAANKK